MALTPEDIAHHLELLDFYKEEALRANAELLAVSRKLRQYNQAIRNTESILRSEGVEFE